MFLFVANGGKSYQVKRMNETGVIPSISSPENGESVVKRYGQNISVICRKITPLSDTQVLSPPSVGVFKFSMIE